MALLLVGAQPSGNWLAGKWSAELRVERKAVGGADGPAGWGDEVNEVPRDRAVSAGAGVGIGAVAVALLGQEDGVAKSTGDAAGAGERRVWIISIPMTRIGFLVGAFHGPV